MITDVLRILELLFIGFHAAFIAGVGAASSEFRFIRAPTDVYVVRDGPFTWPCDITTDEHNGPVRFRWTKNGRNITESQRVVVLPNGSLYFREIVHRKRRGLSDEGSYRCYATNRLGRIVSPPAQLTVAVLPRITAPPGSSGYPVSPSLSTSSLSDTQGADQASVAAVTRAYAGEAIRLSCHITGSTPIPAVVWEKNRVPLPPSLIGRRFFVFDSGILHIINLESSDEADYRCIATNIANERRSPEIRVQVIQSRALRAPRIVSPHQNVTSLAGVNVTLECLVTGSPPARVYWTRQNGAFLLDNERYRQLADGSLRIIDIQHSQQGIYICHADGRPAFDTEYTISAAVRVLVPPKFESRPDPSSVKLLFYAYPLNLRCQVKGHPVPAITWFRNGQPLLIHGRVKTRLQDTALEVGQCQPSDSGYYQCYAQNEAGIVHSATFVRIDEPPHHTAPPVNVTITSHTNTTVSVSWLTPRSSPNYPIIAFSVHHFPVHDGQELQNVVELTPQVEQHYKIEELTPNTNYTIYVAAYTPQGASEHSKYLYQQTAEGVPSAGPVVTLSPSSPTTMLVDWEPLPPGQAGGVIKEYKLVYRNQGLASQYVILPANHRSHLLTGLMPGTKYLVRVEAATRVGYNLNPTEKYWPWVMVTTPTSIPADAPAPPLTSLSAEQTAISAVWEEPSEDEPIVEYRLICVDLSEQREESVTLPADSRSHTFSELKSGTWYEVTVSARNRFGYGREVSQRIQTLVSPGNGSGDESAVGAPIPLPPVGIEVAPVTSSEVRITWSDLPNPEPIVRYSILFYMVQPKPTVQIQEHYRDSSSSVQVAILADLQPFTEYEIAIQSHTQAAKSSYSKKRRFRTLEGVPSSPEDLTGAARRPGTVELHWRPPERTNGIIVSYIIMYNVDDHQNEDHWLKRTHNGSSTSAVIDDLEADKSYFFKLIATTKAGSSPPTPPLRISALCTGPECKAGRREPRSQGVADRSLGIGIGVGIVFGSLVLVVLIVFVKRRCGRSEAPPDDQSSRDQSALYRPTTSGLALFSHGVEIESYIPMLPPLVENSASDTKGGVVCVRVRSGPCVAPTTDTQRVHLLTSNKSAETTPKAFPGGSSGALAVGGDHQALVTDGNPEPPSAAVARRTSTNDAVVVHHHDHDHDHDQENSGTNNQQQQQQQKHQQSLPDNSHCYGQPTNHDRQPPGGDRQNQVDSYQATSAGSGSGSGSGLGADSIVSFSTSHPCSRTLLSGNEPSLPSNDDSRTCELLPPETVA